MSTFKFLVPGPFISNQDMYIPTVNRKTFRAFLRKHTIVDEVKTRIDKVIKSSASYASLSSTLQSAYDENCSIIIDLVVVMGYKAFITKKDSTPTFLALKTKDATNYIKAIEDGVAESIEWDDKYNGEFRVKKAFSKAEDWYCIIEIKVGPKWHTYEYPSLEEYHFSESE